MLFASPVAGLADAAKAATEGISMLPRVFDSVFLFSAVEFKLARTSLANFPTCTDR
jgi:hypothetical protein